MPKGNEDLKAKIAKIQSKGKLPPMPTPTPDAEEPVESDDASMEALEAEFEAKKQALMKKNKSPAKAPTEEPVESDDAEDAGIEQAIAEYADEGKFRVELVFQLVQLNKSEKAQADNLERIANALEGLVNNDEE